MAGIPFNHKGIERLMRNNGYSLIRFHGSHAIWCKDGHNVVIPLSSMNPIVLQRVIKENNLIR